MIKQIARDGRSSILSLISIVVPMRNAEPFVSATLHSLLRQEGCDFEIIVVNDGSTDQSANIVRSISDPRMRMIEGPHRGISAAFNSGLAASRGGFLCRCDADDLYPPGRVARQATWLLNHPEFGAVCGSYSTMDSRGRVIAHHFSDHVAGDETEELLHGRGHSHLSAYLFRTDLLRQIGGCREWFVTSEDADLQYRLAEVARIWFDPACAYLYRLHDGSFTHSGETAQREFFEAASRQYLLQRRNGELDDLQRGTPLLVPSALDRKTRSTSMHIQDILIGEAWSLHAAGRRIRAVLTGLRACIARPQTILAWKSLVALAIKQVGR